MLPIGGHEADEKSVFLGQLWTIGLQQLPCLGFPNMLVSQGLDGFLLAVELL